MKKAKRKTAAIRIKDNCDVTMQNIWISGGDTGVDSTDSNLSVDSVSISGSGKAVKIRGGKKVTIRKLRAKR